MITSSGLTCDICGRRILPVIDDVAVSFSIPWVDRELQCHLGDCKNNVQAAFETKNWKLLKNGPLRDAIEKFFA